VLRTWRQHVAALSQEAAAARVGVSKGALSMWESGKRRPSHTGLGALDTCYGAGGALVDVALALGTPRGLPARHTWAHNPPGPSRPHWAWIRASPGSRRIRAHLRWAAFAFDCSEPCDDRGVVVAIPVSMPNPAAWVHLAEPGWVDFGRGEIPAALGIPVLDALGGAYVAGGGHSAAGLVARPLVERFLGDLQFATDVLRFFGDRPDLVREVFSSGGGGGKVTLAKGQPRQAHEAARPFTGGQLRALREARGLSQADVAVLVTALLPDRPVHDDQIRGVEQGRTPRARFLASRLDTVYRADGRTCREVVDVVWLAFQAGERPSEGRVRLEWGPNVKDMVVSGPATVTCRRAQHDDGPLSVVCPAGWKVTGGMGQDPDARDVNFGWYRAGDPGPAEVTSPAQDGVHDTFLGWFGRTPADFAAFLRRHPPRRP
jgi:transcriptional regulator with XRE-family HTH domain